MTTSDITSQMASNVTNPTSTTDSSSSSSSTASASNPYNLQPQDFMQLMVTQLENQDPTQPVSNEDLLSQMSNIGQLEASTQMTSTMQSMQLQLNLGSSSSLIGKSVTGIDSNNNNASGVVSSVQVAGGNVTLQLDSGDTLPLTGVESIAPDSTTPTSN
jgi:flagellar basal-body rod modification protein FlgD